MDECTYEVLDRLSLRHALIYDKAQRYNAQSPGASSDLWPRLNISCRVDALRADFALQRPALLDAMQRADTAIRALAAEHHVPMGGGPTAPMDSVCPMSEPPAVPRLLELLHEHMLRDGDAVREIKQRATRACEALQAHLDATPRLLDTISRGTAAAPAPKEKAEDKDKEEDKEEDREEDKDKEEDKEEDFAALYALCRQNAERTQRLQARLVRVAEMHREVTAWTNVELGRLDMEIEAIERQTATEGGHALLMKRD